MTGSLLRRVAPSEIALHRADALDADTVARARHIVDDVRAGGEAALRRWASALGDCAPGDALLLGRTELDAAREALPVEQRELLERTHDRVSRFARAQRDALASLDIPVQGGRAGHRVSPVDTAGCYAPGGRFPLPSSVIMTAATARAAGVETVCVASPRPGNVTLAAAAIAGADALLAVGGAHAIAALAYGVDGLIPSCAAVVGPGNRWVTAAKYIVSEHVRIDMLAGPSELLVIADDAAEPELVAADLLAQAEHDPDAIPILVTTCARLAANVDTAIEEQLADLPTAANARAALGNGFTAVVDSIEEAIDVSNRIAPEHLQVLTRDANSVAARCVAFGGLFIGARSAEVLGDYGAGPNHTLPTGGTARHTGGLSVFDFLAIRTWLSLDDPSALARDAEALGRLEGLEAHARAASRRR